MIMHIHEQLDADGFYLKYDQGLFETLNAVHRYIIIHNIEIEYEWERSYYD